MTAIGGKQANRWHLQIADRWVIQYNFYINDRQWGRMFVRLCPDLPFSARVCLNQHHWLATKLREVPKSTPALAKPTATSSIPRIACGDTVPTA
jgi:hypothetical protein